MKRVLYAIALATTLFACQKKEAETADMDEWKAMDDFHMVMADIYHPFKDSANLEPAKTNLAMFESEVNKFAAAELPEKVNTDEVKAAFAALKAEVEAMKTAASDSLLGVSLENAHTRFHEIMEAWHGGGHGREHHEH